MDNEDKAFKIVGPDNLPIRPRIVVCPQCGAGKDKIVPSAGFGIPHLVCNRCGFENFEEVKSA